jgi:hypothetical protein
LTGTCRPALHIELPLESRGRIVLNAANYEDELRLRHWLRGSREWRGLPEIVGRLLDDLDEHDAREAP